MLIIRKKIGYTILLLFMGNSIFSQEKKPFLESPLTEHCSKIKAIDNNKLLVLRMVSEPPSGGFTTQHTDIPASAFSQICWSDFNGSLLKCLPFPDNDSTYYFAEYFEILDNGKIAIGGSINPPDNSAKPFFCIVEEDLSSFEFINHIDTLTGYTVSFNVLNNNIFISNNDFLLQYNSSGLKLSTYNFNSDTIQNPFNWDNNLFAFNNKIYYHYQKTVTIQVPSKNYLVSIDNDYNLNVKYTNVFDTRPLNSVIRIAKRGISYNNYYFISGVFSNSVSENYPSLYKLNINEEFEILFVDSFTNKVSSSIFNLENQIAAHNSTIYLCYSHSSSLEQGILVYSIKENGDLNWKQNIVLENNLSFPSNNNLSLSTLAVNDNNEIFLTIDIKDNFNKKDVYIVKLDSLGNPIDFTTSVFSFSKEETNKPILLFPNPAQEQLNIKTNLKGNFKLEIFDIQGKLVSSFFDISNDTQINLGKFDKGNYFYKIISEQEKEIQTGEFLKK